MIVLDKRHVRSKRDDRDLRGRGIRAILRQSENDNAGDS
jgi:hypothetical protein